MENAKPLSDSYHHLTTAYNKPSTSILSLFSFSQKHVLYTIQIIQIENIMMQTCISI